MADKDNKLKKIEAEDYEQEGTTDSPETGITTSAVVELEAVETNFWDNGKLKKYALQKFMESQEMAWDNRLDVFKKGLLIKKDVEIKALLLKAEEAVENLERIHTNFMQEVVVKVKDDVFKLMTDFAKMATRRWNEASAADMREKYKKKVLDDIDEVWERTHLRIKNGLAQYMDDLEANEEKRKEKEEQKKSKSK
ncbi:MAG: hypothetical protein CV087_16745 [Candidatus Brocadia sp. WS118]|nr:MAG: hypothetical protein CV087_16745 [Candidatus Brocadia sp. WS118]